MPEIKATDPYGCHNRKPLADSVLMQNGHTRPVGFEGHSTRLTILESREFRMSKDCQYDKSGTDPRCAGCKHHNPENIIKYAEKPDGGLMLTLIGATAEQWREFKEWLKRK